MFKISVKLSSDRDILALFVLWHATCIFLSESRCERPRAGELTRELAEAIKNIR